MLDALGIDPMSYNYRFNELVNETIEDFWKTLAIMKREYVFCYTIVLPSFLVCVVSLCLSLINLLVPVCIL